MDNDIKDIKDICLYNNNNPYGYKLNVNHPKINELLLRYKRWKGLPVTFPLSHTQRLDFESYVLKIIKTN